MVLVTVILFLTGIRSFQTWDIAENDQFHELESWGITRVKRDREREVVNKLPRYDKKAGCENLYKTKEVPFTAFVLYRNSGRLLCMGSIVDKEHILTCKLCIDKLETADLLVVLGCFKPWWGRESQVVKVKKVIRHEYMIALLRLKKEIRFTPYVKPVRLPPAHTKSEEYKKAFPPPYYVVGVTVDRYDVPGDYLHKEKLYELREDTFTEFGKCTPNYTRISLETTKLFCISGNATYCWGGRGAPVLQLKQNTYYLQVGVIVFDNCTTYGVAPSLVARTDVFGDWIRQNSYQGHQPQ